MTPTLRMAAPSKAASVRALHTPLASRPAASVLMPKLSPVVRGLHSSRSALADAPAVNKGSTFGKYKTSNVHVLESPAVTTWQEIPRGGINRGKGAFVKIWYNHAVVPIYVVCVFAAGFCGWFLYKYFSVNVEIAWNKNMRGTYDHTGMSDYRSEKHSERLLYPGMRNRNKEPVKMFPFNFIPMQQIAEKRFIDYNSKEREE